MRWAALCCLLGLQVVCAQEEAPPAPTPVPDAQFVPIAARQAAADGNKAFAARDFETARKSYERVLQLAPDNLVGLVNLGMVEFSAGNPKAAEPLLKKAVQIRIETAPAWLALGTLYMDQDRLDEALAALAQATIYEPSNARARNFLGVVCGRKGWYDAAQDELRQALKIDPNYSDAHYNLALFYLEQKPPAIELGRRHYYRAIDLGAQPDPALEKILKTSAP